MKTMIFAITALLLCISSSASAQPYIDIMGPPYNAACNGTADDTAKIQSAISAAQSTGVALYIPKTSNGCRVTSTLNVTWSIKIIGAGTMPYLSGPVGDNSRGPGSWIFFDHSGVGILISNGLGNPISGVSISDIGTRRNQPSPGTGSGSFTPCACGYDFQIIEADVQMDRVTALNPTKLAYVDNLGAVRLTVNDLRAQPLKEGITVHRAYEMIRLNGISFWPYWANLPNVNSYTLGNRKALWLFRVDNPQVSNFFSLYDNNCIVFDYTPDGDSGNGITGRFQGQNIDCDLSAIGVVVSGSAQGTSAQFTNFETLQAQEWSVNSQNILVGAGNVTLDFSNARFSNARSNAVAVAAGSGSKVTLTNAWVENWNRANAGHAAFYADTGATITVSPPPHATGGNGAAVYAGAGTKLQGSVIPQ